MSVIVCRDGIMAADGLICCTGWTVGATDVQKIFRIPDGSLIGFVGATGAMQRMARELIKHPDNGDSLALLNLHKDSETGGLRLMPDGSSRGYDASGETIYPRSMTFTAMGAGHDVAIGAMEMGATAREACAIAIRRNIGARGKVQWLRVRKQSSAPGEARISMLHPGEVLFPPEGNVDRRCRFCGCTDDNACVNKGQPCHWVLSTCCSTPACVAKLPPWDKAAIASVASRTRRKITAMGRKR